MGLRFNQGRTIVKKTLACIATILALVGCGNRSAVLRAPFDEQAAQKQLTAGVNSIRGSALIRQQGGGVVTCAGNQVVLMPVTARAREWATEVFESTSGGYRQAGGRGVVFDETDPFWRATREATCDAQGNFRFDGLPDGDFYVFTRITWRVGYNIQGGALMKSARLAGGVAHDVVLSPGGL